MKLVNNYSHKLLLDGTESELNKYCRESEIPLSALKSLGSLKHILTEIQFQTLIESIDAKKIEPFETYKKDNVTVEYFERVSHDRNITIISIGEVQPGRYKLFMESEWKL